MACAASTDVSAPRDLPADDGPTPQPPGVRWLCSVGSPLELAPGVVFRRERFGAVLYDRYRGRFSFLRSPLVADLVGALIAPTAGRPEAVLGALTLDQATQERLAAALVHLWQRGVLRPREPGAGTSSEGPTPLSPSRPGDPRSDRPSSLRGGPAGRLRSSGRLPSSASPSAGLRADLVTGLSAPLCLTWELTYGCNLACVHCLSSSGRRDPRELTTAEAVDFLEELSRLKVPYANVGGGEPFLRPDLLELAEEASRRGVGLKISTNGTRLTTARARRLAALTGIDVQVSLDGATATVNDALRGPGSYDAALRALDRLVEAGLRHPKLSVVVTRENVHQLDALHALASAHGATLRLTRLRPSGRGARSWAVLALRPADPSLVASFLARHEDVLTGDSFFHLTALGVDLAGLNLCGAGRVVCLVDPIGDVYACPFLLQPDYRAGSIRDPGGFRQLWDSSPVFTSLRQPLPEGLCRTCAAGSNCGGGCLAAKAAVGLPPEAPDPECVLGHGIGPEAPIRLLPGPDHSRRAPARPLLVRAGRPVAPARCSPGTGSL